MNKLKTIIPIILTSIAAIISFVFLWCLWPNSAFYIESYIIYSLLVLLTIGCAIGTFILSKHSRFKSKLITVCVLTLIFMILGICARTELIGYPEYSAKVMENRYNLNVVYTSFPDIPYDTEDYDFKKVGIVQGIVKRGYPNEGKTVLLVFEYRTFFPPANITVYGLDGSYDTSKSHVPPDVEYGYDDYHTYPIIGVLER